MAPKETTEFDFAPFNPDQVLRALCSVLRTSKRISWNYAGDLQSVIDRIGRVFEASRALLFVSAGGREVAEIFEFDEPGLAPVAHHFSSPYSQRLAQYLISLPDELSLIEVPQKFAGELDESYREIFLRVFDHFGSQHCHLVPLKMYSEAGGERRAGLLLVQESARSGRFNKLVLESLLAIADCLARLAEVELLVNSLEAKETVDPKTGLLNRRGFMKQVESEIERAAFCADELSLLFIDLDLNKRSPDLYGSQHGEAIIKTAASAVVGNTRKIDSVARWGADEFLVCLPRVTADEALSLADTTRRRINEALMNLARSLPKQIDVWYPQTASLGLAHMQKEAATFDKLFSCAQEALSQAQAAGGNIVKVAQRIES